MMVAFARKDEVITGLIRRTLPSQVRRGNAEGWREANSLCPVETHRSADPATGEPILGFRCRQA